LRHQQLLLEQNLATQGTLNQQLVDQLAQQVKALDQVNLALQDAQRRLLSRREEERKRLARELHDEIIQDLVSINLELENIEASKDVTTVLRSDLIDIRESIRILIADVRRICGDLRPPTIDSLGLGSALLSHTRTWSERTGISVYLDLAPDLVRLPENIELSLFRIVQEGLNNVRKHSQATSVRVQLQHTSPRTLMISIADNGKGIVGKVNLASLSANGHFGLLGLSERVALLGGHLKIQSQNEGGLLLQAEIPHPRVEDATLGTNINWLQ
jgi:signal transduction histidine kinase